MIGGGGGGTFRVVRSAAVKLLLSAVIAITDVSDGMVEDFIIEHVATRLMALMGDRLVMFFDSYYDFCMFHYKATPVHRSCFWPVADIFQMTVNMKIDITMPISCLLPI